MKSKHLLVLAAFTALLLPATAHAGVGNGKPTGRPDHAVGPVKPADHPAATAPGIVKVREAAPVETTTAPAADAPQTTAEKTRAYGSRCAGESRKRVPGQKGTPFSRCVNAMAKAAGGDAPTAKAACKGLSKKHVRGSKGTPFSRCVVAASKLIEAQPDPVEQPAADQDPIA